MNHEDAEAKFWKHCEEAMARIQQAAGAPMWTSLTITYTTDSTTVPASTAGYTEGFGDGWNAHEATLGDPKG